MRRINSHVTIVSFCSWWRHQMKTFSALLSLCAGDSPVTGEFPSQRPLMRRFDVFFDLYLDKRLSKQSKRQWFDTPSYSSWRHCNAYSMAKSKSMKTPYEQVSWPINARVSPGSTSGIGCQITANNYSTTPSNCWLPKHLKNDWRWPTQWSLSNIDTVSNHSRNYRSHWSKARGLP